MLDVHDFFLLISFKTFLKFILKKFILNMPLTILFKNIVVVKLNTTEKKQKKKKKTKKLWNIFLSDLDLNFIVKTLC